LPYNLPDIPYYELKSFPDMRSYYPLIERDILEFKEISSLEGEIFKLTAVLCKQFLDNQYILTSDSDGLYIFEAMAGVAPDLSSETLDCRKWRLLNLVNDHPPFTLRFLKAKLDSVLGAGNWTVTQNFDRYTLIVDTSVDPKVFELLRISLVKLIPCEIKWLVKNTRQTPLDGAKYRAVMPLRYKETLIGDLSPQSGGKRRAVSLLPGKQTIIGDG
jgi:hypothetical protein